MCCVMIPACADGYCCCCRNGGIDTEKDYKYKAQDGVCNIAKEKRHVVTIDSYEDVPPNDESALKKVCTPVLLSACCSIPCMGYKSRSLRRSSDSRIELIWLLPDAHWLVFSMWNMFATGLHGSCVKH